MGETVVGFSVIGEGERRGSLLAGGKDSEGVENLWEAI
jgi:hypothetical protein